MKLIHQEILFVVVMLSAAVGMLLEMFTVGTVLFVPAVLFGLCLFAVVSFFICRKGELTPSLHRCARTQRLSLASSSCCSATPDSCRRRVHFPAAAACLAVAGPSSRKRSS